MPVTKPKDPIWEFFIVSRNKAKCRNCNALLSVHATRLKSHKFKCFSNQPHLSLESINSTIETPSHKQVSTPTTNIQQSRTKHVATQTNEPQEDFDDPITTFQAGSTHIVFGQSGSGKTRFIHRVLKHKRQVFGDRPPVKIQYYYGIWQDFFAEFEKDIDNITFHQGLPTEEELLAFSDPNIHTLIVIDDLMHEACNSQVIELIFTRLSHHRFLSCFYLLQNPFVQGKTQSTINVNAKYIEIFRSPRSLMQLRYLNSQLFPDCPGLLVDSYNDVMKCNQYGYLVIDLTANCPDEIRIRTKVFPGEQTIVYKND